MSWFSLTKLEKFNERKLLKLLVFINPDNKEYWKQLSGFYYTQDFDDKSLAGLELLYEKFFDTFH